MLTLGIDTSGLGGSIAIARDGNCLAERALSRTGRRHARTLVAELKALFDDTRLRPHDCNTVAVSIGPGSFTGLRVGVVCAKTFAYATRCTLVAVDTHLAVAAASRTTSRKSPSSPTPCAVKSTPACTSEAPAVPGRHSNRSNACRSTTGPNNCRTMRPSPAPA